MSQQAGQGLQISHSGDVIAARRAAKAMASGIGFDDLACEEIALCVTELATNLVVHAGGGTLTLTSIVDGGRVGMQVVSLDTSPGIPDVERAMADGFSTAGGLGHGLGTVNRLMDEFDIASVPARGTSIVCKRWVRKPGESSTPCPLSFGVATRPCRGMTLNGDSFVIKRWEGSALVGVIDGLGHGQFAHRAAETARRFIETHFDLSLDALFRRTGQACRATRGMVMALARFDWATWRLTFCSVGNIVARAFGPGEHIHLISRRGVVGGRAPSPRVTEHRWAPGKVMVLHSDGLSTHWRWQDFAPLADRSADAVASGMLAALAKDHDDATVLVVRDKA